VKKIRRAQLAQVIDALASSRRLSGSLNGRKQERHQDANDRNYDQQLDERKAARPKRRANIPAHG
jgi:hypothetical protein